MNLKRIFGAIVTVLGIASLIYAAVLFITNASNENTVKAWATCGIIGLPSLLQALA